MAKISSSSKHEYLTTKEVADHLRLNEKKVYAMVAAGQLPAARISGKWLFPRELIDNWVSENTVYPRGGLLGALLDELVVLQGSDDFLLGRLLEEIQEELGRPIPTTSVGSLAGIQSLGLGRAHIAGCHLDRAVLETSLAGGSGWYLLDLFGRSQGLIFDQEAHPECRSGIESVRGLRMACRQRMSGTHRLTERLLAGAGIDESEVVSGARCSGHLEVALAVRQGRADFGIGIEVAAAQCSLAFVPLRAERFQLVLAADHLTHPVMQRLLDILLSKLREAPTDAPPGYSFEHSGRMVPLFASSAEKD